MTPVDDYIQWFFQDPLCEHQFYYIIFMIGLTFMVEAIGATHKFLKTQPYNKLNDTFLPGISYKIIFCLGIVLASSLIIFDLLKIVFDLDVFCRFNLDAIIKFFICANVSTMLIIALIITLSKIREVYIKEMIKTAEPLYPPEDTYDSTNDVEDRRALA